MLLMQQPMTDGDEAFTKPAGFADKNIIDFIQSALPIGFHPLIQKIIRAVILGRPLRITRFISEFLDIELTKRTFGDMECGCYRLKSKKAHLMHYDLAQSVVRNVKIPRLRQKPDGVEINTAMRCIVCFLEYCSVLG
jgi:hypothetical protein